MATAWPIAADVIEWIGGTTSAAQTALVGPIVDDVTDDLLARIPAAALPGTRRPGGANEDCPPRLRRAIILECGRVFSRRSSLNGIQISAEVFARISAVDPDVRRYMSTLTNWPEA